jgi:hypothetical protein
VRGLGRGGGCVTRLAPRFRSVYHLAHLFGPFRAFVEARGPSPMPISDSMIPDPGSVKGGIRQSDGWFTRPRAVAPLAAENLVVEMFEEVGIGFVGEGPRWGRSR